MKQDLLNKKNKLINGLKKKGITDLQVLDAIKSVKRELFVPSIYKDKSYDDNALPINANQTISQPYTVAFMSSLLNVSYGEKVLEIGTGSGYQAAILKAMGIDVYSIERISELAESAKSTFNQLSLKVKIKIGDGSLGWTDHAPYDGIIVTAASPKIIETLKFQLRIGANLVIPVGDQTTQKMIVIKRSSESVFTESRYQNFKFVPLIGENGFNE